MKRLVGIPGAEGIVEGTAFLIERPGLTVTMRPLPPDGAEAECQRYCTAVDVAARQLRRIQDKLAARGGDTLILEAHRMIVTDPHLRARTLHIIRSEQVNAEWALQKAAREVIQVFDEVVDDEYLRERRSDVASGVRHLLYTLSGAHPQIGHLPVDAVVVAHELSAAELARLHRDHLRAYVTEAGGRTAHTVIMARSMGIAAVVGAQGAVAAISWGDALIVDGDRGEVVVNPDQATAAYYRQQTEARAARARSLREPSELPAVTLDGIRVRVMVNAELPEEIPGALDSGADGVGLYRTELLYLGRPSPPDEEAHLANAQRVLQASRGLPVTFRTCDLDYCGDPSVGLKESNRNPAMGLRSIRLALQQPEGFKAELRGLLRAADGHTLRVMFPMVSSLPEVRQAKALLMQCRDEISGGPSELTVGIMVEMPSAALVADQLAREVDFFAIGTNDLIQYTLGVDRANDRVSYLYRPLHPAILRLIRGVVRAGQEAGIPVSVCGEMAGDPKLVMLLLGLGVRELSMGAPSVPTVKRVIRHGRLADAEDLARRVELLSTAQEIEVEVEQSMRSFLDVSEVRQAANADDSRC